MIRLLGRGTRYHDEKNSSSFARYADADFVVSVHIGTTYCRRIMQGRQ
jgi:hypothetical protein